VRSESCRELCVSGNEVDGWMDTQVVRPGGEVNQVENDTVVMKLIST
jgi:hypothetical protein